MIRCYKCGKMGHIAGDCKSEFNVRELTYEQAQEHFRTEWRWEVDEIEKKKEELKDGESQ
jgi:hypothetical protein